MNPKRGSAEGAIQSIAAPPSIPDVTLVEIDAVVAQQVAVFFLKCAIAMVLWLLLNVYEHKRRADSGSPKMRHIRAARKSRDTVDQPA